MVVNAQRRGKDTIYRAVDLLSLIGDPCLSKAGLLLDGAGF
jgi:hypothetical protein